MHLEHVILGGRKNGVESLQHNHRQDHIAVFTSYIEVTEHIVGDSPQEVRDPVDVLVVAHATPEEFLLSANARSLPQIQRFSARIQKTCLMP